MPRKVTGQAASSGMGCCSVSESMPETVNDYNLTECYKMRASLAELYGKEALAGAGICPAQLLADKISLPSFIPAKVELQPEVAA